MTQDILSALDSDNINSISDTVEAAQVVAIIESVFNSLAVNRRIPEHRSIRQLIGLSDVNSPNYLKIPSGVTRIRWIKYDITETGDNNSTWRTLRYKTPEDFVDDSHQLNSEDDTVISVIDPNSGVTLFARNDKMPEFWTSFDDEFIAFDSFDIAEDSTLQQSKTLVLAATLPVFSRTDSHIPDIDEDLFPFLLEESKSIAFANLKQNVNPKIESNARREKIRSQKLIDNFIPENNWSDYGRK